MHGNEELFCFRLIFFLKNSKNVRCENATKGTSGSQACCENATMGTSGGQKVHQITISFWYARDGSVLRVVGSNSVCPVGSHKGVCGPFPLTKFGGGGL